MTIDKLIHEKFTEHNRLILENYSIGDLKTYNYIVKLANEIRELIEKRKLIIRVEKIEKLRHNIKNK